MLKIPLEDSFADVIGKAQRGLKLTDETVAQRAGISTAELASLKEGTFEQNAVAGVAKALDLHAQSLFLLGTKAWYPADHDVDGLEQFNTQFEDMTVNSYVIWDKASREAVFFDTGANATAMLDLVKHEGLKVSFILLTHTHPDHIADLARVKKVTGAEAYVGEKEAFPHATAFTHGKAFQAGSLKIQTRQTSGHAKGGISYFVTGLAKPVVVVGDALFAGSMGGGAISYVEALETNRRNLFSLPDETIVCAGHGPLTTIGEQRLVNPYFPEFKTG